MSRCDSARHADPAYHRGSDDGSEWRRGGWILESLVVSPARSPRALQGLVSDHSQQQYLPTGSVDELVDNPEHYSFFTWNCKALLSLPHFKAGAKRLNHLNYIVSNVKLSTIVYATLDVLRGACGGFLRAAAPSDKQARAAKNAPVRSSQSSPWATPQPAHFQHLSRRSVPRGHSFRGILTLFSVEVVPAAH
jgi:hypothetical protein